MEENPENLLEHFIKLTDSLGKRNYFRFLILVQIN